ncbi:MAG: hypothetical protein MI923_22565, partial [Phycisphaerales bacterium]|nr:hypothetical protein [Phycisphaerales bacterium]
SDLQTGFNLISFPLRLQNQTLRNATNDGYEFALQPDCLVSLWRYNASGFERTDWDGSKFVPAAGDEIFTNLNMSRGYWLETNNTCELTTVGIVPQQDVNISLADGWTAAPWHSVEEKELPVDFDPILLKVTPNHSIETIDRYNATSGEFEVTVHYVISGSPWGWFPSFNNPQFRDMDPTMGYYFDTTPAAVWEHEP